MKAFEFVSVEELFARVAAEDERQASLSPRDPEHRKMFELTGDGEVLIYWGGYEYPYDLDRIQRPEDLIWLIHHIGKKTWKHMTAARISRLVECIANEKGWPPYGRVRHANEMPSASIDARAEREKMTPAIRYQVLTRDGHRCRCCGNSVSTGAILHIDHIIPVSKGGRTILANLQALCSACNIGKRDRT